MDADKFDALMHQVLDDASRRGVIRAGIGALSALALMIIELGGGNDAAADSGRCKKRCGECQRCEKGKCRRTSRGKRCKSGKCRPKGNGTPCACGTCQSGFCALTPPTSPPTCPPERPAACPNGGCCPSAFPLCCPASPRTTGATCNAAGRTCCPEERGGGSCGSNRPQCCPPTDQAPAGSCARSTDICCTSAQGALSCPAGSACCTTNAECTGLMPTGQTCQSGCCAVVAPGVRSASSPSLPTSDTERFILAAQ